MLGVTFPIGAASLCQDTVVGATDLVDSANGVRSGEGIGR